MPRIRKGRIPEACEEARKAPYLEPIFVGTLRGVGGGGVGGLNAQNKDLMRPI